MPHVAACPPGCMLGKVGMRLFGKSSVLLCTTACSPSLPPCCTSGRSCSLCRSDAACSQRPAARPAGRGAGRRRRCWRAQQLCGAAPFSGAQCRCSQQGERGRRPGCSHCSAAARPSCTGGEPGSRLVSLAGCCSIFSTAPCLASSREHSRRLSAQSTAFALHPASPNHSGCPTAAHFCGACPPGPLLLPRCSASGPTTVAVATRRMPWRSGWPR